MNDYGPTRENMIASLPPALQRDPLAVALAEAMADALSRRPEEIDRVRLYPAIDRLEADVLDTLADDFKVDWWDADYSLDEKRRTLKSSWKVHKLLGTKAAVELGLRAIYPNSWAEPWFDYEEGRGEPYHFRLHVDLSDEMLAEGKPTRVMERVRYYQSLRDHLDEIRYTIEAKQPATLKLGTGMGTNASIGVHQAQDAYNFHSAVCMAGTMGAQQALGILCAQDVFHFSDTVRSGAARAGEQALLPMAEDVAVQNQVSILRAGGSFVMAAPTIFPTEEG